MNHHQIVEWLRETDPTRLERLWHDADATRRRHVGPEVHLRGLVEVSSYCVRLCGYCGLRAANTKSRRYRMSKAEILDTARQAVALGYGTLVLQSGEDPGITVDWMTDVIRRIKAATPLAVTLSLGERADDELSAWRAAGADRYLLRFETSNRDLYHRIHPPRGDSRRDRMVILETLRRLDYELGSGVMIGIPGQSYDDLARDIEQFAALELDMIGVGPYLPHPDTPLAHLDQRPASADDQTPNDELTTYKVIALTRLVRPEANIPATTALATINGSTGWEQGLSRGANVIMPNLTPAEYRALYDIYPDKVCVHETDADRGQGLRHRIAAIGRTVGVGRGDAPSYVAGRKAAWTERAESDQDTTSTQESGEDSPYCKAKENHGLDD